MIAALSLVFGEMYVSKLFTQLKPGCYVLPGYLGQGSLNWDTGNQFSSHLSVIVVGPGGERHHCPIYYKLGSEFEEEGEKGKPRLPVANADFALVAVGTLPIPLLVGRFAESIDFTT